MSTAQLIAAIVMIIVYLILIVVVLMQKKRQANLSGAITGMDSNFFDKTKGKKKDAKLENITKVSGAILFVFAIVTTTIIVLNK